MATKVLDKSTYSICICETAFACVTNNKSNIWIGYKYILLKSYIYLGAVIRKLYKSYQDLHCLVILLNNYQ